MSTRPSTKKPSDEPVDLSDQESPDISKQFPRLATLTSVEERDASTAINATAAAGLQSRLGERRRMRYDVSMEPLIQERELEGTEGNGLGTEVCVLFKSNRFRRSIRDGFQPPVAALRAH